MTRIFLICLAILTLVNTSSAQDESKTDWSAVAPRPDVPQGENMKIPEGWMWRLDRPNSEVKLVSEEDPTHANIFFVNMTPGWHITTGPAAILYHPAMLAEGSYRAETTYHLFQPTEHREAFGLFVGGDDLAGDDQTYLYFVIRKSGEFLVKRRDGSETSLIQDWTAHPAIKPYTTETSGSVENALAVEVGPDTIDFYVNGEKVAESPRGDLPTEGIVGLRMNHRLNVHVSDLRVSPLP